MKQTIKIGEKEYLLEYNALTYVEYTEMFNKGVFEDIQEIQNFIAKQVAYTTAIREEKPDITDEQLEAELSTSMLGDVDRYIQAVTRLAYMGIYSATPNFKPYKDWLRDIKDISTNDMWIVEVTEFAVKCFC